MSSKPGGGRTAIADAEAPPALAGGADDGGDADVAERDAGKAPPNAASSDGGKGALDAALTDEACSAATADDDDGVNAVALGTEEADAGPKFWFARAPPGPGDGGAGTTTSTLQRVLQPGIGRTRRMSLSSKPTSSSVLRAQSCDRHVAAGSSVRLTSMEQTVEELLAPLSDRCDAAGCSMMAKISVAALRQALASSSLVRKIGGGDGGGGRASLVESDTSTQ